MAINPKLSVNLLPRQYDLARFDGYNLSQHNILTPQR
jgi:hypothetical protein